MPGDTYPKFRAAAVQAAPVFLDRDATIDKLEMLVQKAVDAGADLIVFGESFIPAFPVWNLIYAPIDQHGFFRRLFDNAVQVSGPHTRKLSEIARRHHVLLSVGITEKDSVSLGTPATLNSEAIDRSIRGILAVGPNRLITFPLRPTRNFVKFHLILSVPKMPFSSLFK